MPSSLCNSLVLIIIYPALLKDQKTLTMIHVPHFLRLKTKTNAFYLKNVFAGNPVIFIKNFSLKGFAFIGKEIFGFLLFCFKSMENIVAKCLNYSLFIIG